MMSEAVPSVLITDDEPGLRLALRVHFEHQGWHAETASGVGEARAWLQRRAFALVLCDVQMPDGNGFEVMEAVREAAPNTAILFLTAHGSVPEAVRAMQGGAVDYLTKPVAFDHLLSVAKRIIHERRPAGRDERTEVSGIVGRSRALQLAMARGQAAAESDADVLIEAESGTGKELLARFVHESSGRREKPFVAINCAALPETLLESELFGHSRGAFTGAIAAKPGKFELAHGGTLLLDEIGDMPLSLQPKLLRVLQERVVERLGGSRPVPVDIRIVAATNMQLRQRVDRGLFRSDLFYRLNVIPLTLPALRERTEDIPLLAQHYAEQFATRTGQPRVRLHASFLERLESYEWPGNVRELGNFMQRVLSLSRTQDISAAVFDQEHQPLVSAPSEIRETHESRQPLSMDQVERSHLERTLELVGGNRTRAAELLGISVRTMRNKIRQYDLPPRRYA